MEGREGLLGPEIGGRTPGSRSIPRPRLLRAQARALGGSGPAGFAHGEQLSPLLEEGRLEEAGCLRTQERQGPSLRPRDSRVWASATTRSLHPGPRHAKLLLGLSRLASSSLRPSALPWRRSSQSPCHSPAYKPH